MNKQDIFEALGLSEHNSGVFAGEWTEATGEQVEVVNPTTGEVLGRVQAERYGARLLHARVAAAAREGGRFRLTTTAGPVSSDALVLATGIVDRQPSCGNLYGETYSGVHYCVICDGWETRGRTVAVIGHDAHAHEMLQALRPFTRDLVLLLEEDWEDDVCRVTDSDHSSTCTHFTPLRRSTSWIKSLNSRFAANRMSAIS